MAQSKQPNLIALCVVSVSLPTIAVALRICGGHMQQDRKFGWDDVFAIATLPFIWAENALALIWISLGFGKHADDVPEQNLGQSPKLIILCECLNNAAISFPKFSALFFYRRIYGRTCRWFSRGLWIVGILNAAWLMASWISTLLRCDPVEKSWKPEVNGHCFSQWPWFLGTAISSTLIDLVILIMPLPILWHLQTSTQRKILITGLFVCGYSVIVVSIGRLVALAKAVSSIKSDITWGAISYLEWLQCEAPVSLVSVCLPNIFNLARRLHQYRLRGLHSGGNDFAVRGRVTNLAHGRDFIKLKTLDGVESETYRRDGLGSRTKAFFSPSRNKTNNNADDQIEVLSLESRRSDRIYVEEEVDVHIT